MRKLLLWMGLLLIAVSVQADPLKVPVTRSGTCSGLCCPGPPTMSGNGGHLDMTTTPPVMTGVNVNGVVNPLTYPGADIGAQINAAIAANAATGGEILIPPGVYTFGTGIQCPIGPGRQPFIIRGAGRAWADSAHAGGATILVYTGNGDAINQVYTNTAYQNSTGCVLRDFTLDGASAGTAAVGFRFGGTAYTAVSNVEIQSFGGAGIEIENASGMFTERYNFDATLWRNQIGIYYHCDTGCQQSFEHGKVKVWLNVLNQAGTAQEGIKADAVDASHQALVTAVEFHTDGNVEGTGSGGILYHAAANSYWNNNTYAQYAECNESVCTRVKVDPASGAVFAGQWLTDVADVQQWQDLATPGTTFGKYGFSDNNKPFQFNADVNKVVNAQTWGAVGDGTTDNSAAFQSAVNEVGVQGTIYIPAGTYVWNTPGVFNFTQAAGNLRVSIVGDSTGATILEPNFSGADSTHLVDAISYTYNANQYMAETQARVEHIRFWPPSAGTPSNINLLRFANVGGVAVKDIYATGFGNNGTLIDLDNGGYAATSFTERIVADGIVGTYNTHFVKLDGRGVISSLNNNIVTNAHCDPWGTGDCIYMTGYINGSEGISGGCQFTNWNVDLNNGGTNGGQAVVRTTHKAGDLSYATELGIIAQNTGSASPNYCFDAPTGSGFWDFLGRVQCQIGVFTYEKGGNTVFNQIASASPQLAGVPSLAFDTTYGMLRAPAFMGNGTPSITGGASFQPGSNSTTGEIVSTPTTGNVFSPGFTCAHAVVGGMFDGTSRNIPQLISRSPTSITFNVTTAGDVVDYFGMGCI
jgi:hypothetical protein